MSKFQRLVQTPQSSSAIPPIMKIFKCSGQIIQHIPQHTDLLEKTETIERIIVLFLEFSYPFPSFIFCKNLQNLNAKNPSNSINIIKKTQYRCIPVARVITMS